MNVRPILLCLVLLGPCQTAQSTEPAAPADIISHKQARCGDGNMLEMTTCIHSELKESDAHLNLVYRRLIDALDQPRDLRRAQRAWMAFRDTQCDFETGGLKGGSAHSFSRSVCLVKLTEQRIAELEHIQPCNGCARFRPEFYRGREFHHPARPAHRDRPR